MRIKNISIGLILVALTSCNSNTKSAHSEKPNYDNVSVVGAMKNVMWKGELDGIINLDSIENKNGLYGIGPKSFLTGEILINDGRSYVSKVVTDSTMTVEKNFDVSAPFFVYANVTEWDKIDLPKNIKSINELEQFVDKRTTDFKRPFVFKLIGKVLNAVIHVQNLPLGTQVSSPEEAHRGQVNYNLKHEDVEIVGFFSTEHKGIFTHHDSFLHLHLITEDESKMGHLDSVDFDTMQLFLPKK